ncbi:MAG: hypothetical protein JRN15_01960 [Nitrososphaerota archaeon]|nr:hypothetical protein [Nitrososphaerota archaeon]
MQKTISLLSIVNSSLGSVNVNFDAETRSERLDFEDYGRVHDLGARWSETFQASKEGSARAKSSLIKKLLKEFKSHFSANLVIGNAAYGLRPSYGSLEHMTLRLTPLSSRELKLGAEGSTNGRKTIDLAAKTGATAYILHTSSIDGLLDYAKEKRVRFMVYTLCRIAESRALAAADLMRIKGTGYFERRKVLREDISQRLCEFSIFGTGEEVASQVKSLVARGASKVVLYPVFQGTSDLISQMNSLSDWIE